MEVQLTPIMCFENCPNAIQLSKTIHFQIYTFLIFEIIRHVGKIAFFLQSHYFKNTHVFILSCYLWFYCYVRRIKDTKISKYCMFLSDMQNSCMNLEVKHIYCSGTELHQVFYLYSMSELKL